jgi:hypothetical protein
VGLARFESTIHDKEVASVAIAASLEAAVLDSTLEVDKSVTHFRANVVETIFNCCHQIITLPDSY